MHDAAFRAVGRMLMELDLGSNAKLKVLEVGSYDVNGSVRPFFAGCHEYVGVDVRSGPGVDVMADGSEFGEDNYYDVVISTEVLEHAKDPAAIVANARRVLKPGGGLVLTCAGLRRPHHSNDGLEVGTEYYKNVDPDDLAAWLKPFKKSSIEENPEVHDLYAWGIK